ncbi:hypothetical protein EIP91_006745 [Steccherinum ochraceum]|uniref:Uncharacterized protein n=1 Tax=Steccherinum ochraceum TaxID=92696 RepID=A0A4R0R559_9APHY|nr:hypothetical protein EIP91_006745 [Steccherinum ochraceum]
MVTGRLRAPDPGTEGTTQAGNTPDNMEDDSLKAPVTHLCQLPISAKPANYEAVKAVTEARRIVWGGRQIFFNLPQTYLVYYGDTQEAGTKVEIDNIALVLYQPLAGPTVKDPDYAAADTAGPEELALVLYRPLSKPSVTRFYITPDGIAYEFVDGLVVGRRPRRSKKQRSRVFKAGSLALVLYDTRKSRIADCRKFYGTPAGVVHAVVESLADTTGLDDLPVVLYRPLCIAPPVGYRKYYVTPAGVAYEMVGRPIPKRRTRRGKKNKARQPEAESENKENEEPQQKVQPKEKVRVQQPKTPWSRRWCSAQRKAALAAGDAPGSPTAATDSTGSPLGCLASN